MEISLPNCIYTINPRRIIAIESYKTEARISKHMGYHVEPFSEETDHNGNPIPYTRHVVVRMTDGFNIHLLDDNNSYRYKKLRDELTNIVGG